MTEWIILTIPFAGTALGAAMVFLLKNGLGSRVKNCCWVLLPAL